MGKVGEQGFASQVGVLLLKFAKVESQSRLEGVMYDNDIVCLLYTCPE